MKNKIIFAKFIINLITKIGKCVKNVRFVSSHKYERDKSGPTLTKKIYKKWAPNKVLPDYKPQKSFNKPFQKIVRSNIDNQGRLYQKNKMAVIVNQDSSFISSQKIRNLFNEDKYDRINLNRKKRSGLNINNTLKVFATLRV